MVHLAIGRKILHRGRQTLYRPYEKLIWTRKKDLHRCKSLFIWLPDLDSNQGPAD